MAGKLKRPYFKKYYPFGRGVRSIVSNRKGLHPLKKAMLEETVKRIVGKGSRSMTAHSARQSNNSIENSPSPDDPVPDIMFEYRHNEHTTGRTSSGILQNQHKKRGQMKNVVEFPGTSKNPKVAKVKNTENRNKSSENPVMEYMEYAVAVTSHWDREFVKKFSTKNYLLETLRQLQDIYFRKKLFASHMRKQPLDVHVEASLVQPDHTFSACFHPGRTKDLSAPRYTTEQEHTSQSPLLSDSPPVIFSPQIPPPTPILDPLQYLRKVFPISEDKTPHPLQKKNITSEYLPAKHPEGGLRQQMLDNIQQCGHDGNKSTSLEPYSTIPLLPSHMLHADTFDPGAQIKIYRAAGLYVPCKFSISMDTADVNFRYYPHTF